MELILLWCIGANARFGKVRDLIARKRPVASGRFGVDTRQSHGNTVQLMNPASFLILFGLPMLFVIAIMVLVIAMKRFVVSRWRRYREEREGEARRTVEPP